MVYVYFPISAVDEKAKLFSLLRSNKDEQKKRKENMKHPSLNSE